MSLDLARNKIFNEFEALRLRWEKAQVHWQDIVQQQFSEEHWSRLDEAVVTILTAMDRLGPIVVQARQDCASREFL